MLYIKNEKLNFYTVDESYINYLMNFDTHIAYNKNQKRPYIGIIIEISNQKYFAPLFSPKPQHLNYKDNLTFHKIINSKSNNFLGIIKFLNMIPVPNQFLSKLNLQNQNYSYKRLISMQYSCINNSKNFRNIKEKANKLYTIITSNKNNKTYKFYEQICCNFKLLEEKSILYIQINSKNTNF